MPSPIHSPSPDDERHESPIAGQGSVREGITPTNVVPDGIVGQRFNDAAHQPRFVRMPRLGAVEEVTPEQFQNTGDQTDSPGGIVHARRVDDQGDETPSVVVRRADFFEGDDLPSVVRHALSEPDERPPLVVESSSLFSPAEVERAGAGASPDELKRVQQVAKERPAKQRAALRARQAAAQRAADLKAAAAAVAQKAQRAAELKAAEQARQQAAEQVVASYQGRHALALAVPPAQAQVAAAVIGYQQHQPAPRSNGWARARAKLLQAQRDAEQAKAKEHEDRSRAARQARRHAEKGQMRRLRRAARAERRAQVSGLSQAASERLAKDDREVAAVLDVEESLGATPVVVRDAARLRRSEQAATAQAEAERPGSTAMSSRQARKIVAAQERAERAQAAAKAAEPVPSVGGSADDLPGPRSHTISASAEVFGMEYDAPAITGKKDALAMVRNTIAGVRCQQGKDAVHMVVAWRPDQLPTRVEMVTQGRRYLHRLHLDPGRAVGILHHDSDAPHLHIIASRVDDQGSVLTTFGADRALMLEHHQMAAQSGDPGRFQLPAMTAMTRQSRHAERLMEGGDLVTIERRLDGTTVAHPAQGEGHLSLRNAGFEMSHTLVCESGPGMARVIGNRAAERVLNYAWR